MIYLNEIKKNNAKKILVLRALALLVIIIIIWGKISLWKLSS
jgi:F0F1-type ATP synthase assembly protein I